VTRRRERKLRPDEEELWEKVRHSAVPLHPDKRAPVQSSPAKTKPVQQSDPIPAFKLGQAAASTALPHDLAMGLREQLNAAPLRMDRKRHGQIRKGRQSPEGRIDLHGMTIAQAHPALLRFIVQSHADGKRLVLVITGKGKPRDEGGPIPVRLGVLKNQVPHWLQAPPLRDLVLQVMEAHLKHGGSGAYYVYLRRA